jgi:polygalacturonase
MRVHLLCIGAFILSTIAADLKADDTLNLLALFKAAKEHSTITIPPGDYILDGTRPIEIKSNLTVMAAGARFRFPSSLEDQAQIVLFRGENIRNFRWQGGHFEGNVFDPANANNTWPPNANTRAIVIQTTTDGVTSDLTFRDISSHGLAGAAVTVLGAAKVGSDREIARYAQNVTLQNCTLERTGKFMWDYGFLWQTMVWPEEFNEAQRAMAQKYFRNDLVCSELRIEANDDRIFFDNKKPLPVSETRAGAEAERGYDSVCFFGSELPTNISKGRQYFVVESQPDFIRISESVGGPVIRFSEGAGPAAKLITNLFHAHLALYAPKGSGPGKGALDLVGCKNVIVQGCRLSALGDTMHIQKCDGVVFSGNHITASRMGAFFLAEFCENASITGNTVDGTNGSRVLSVEPSRARYP